ncbi:MAG: hypothetical protein ABIJ40_12100 [Bacteroidota bacterium]
MKKIILMLIPMLMLFLLVISSCDTTEPDKPKNYNYSISKVFWTDSVDNNKDGHTTNRVLWIHVNLEENVTRTIEARLYYKPTLVSTYTYYGSTAELNIDGINSPLTIQYMIGPPIGRELMYGTYDFSVEIYEIGSERIEASATKEDTSVTGSDFLTGQNFEALNTDQIYSVKVWWKNIIDKNGNGNAQKAELFVDVNIDDDLTKEVTTELYYKERNDEKYALYAYEGPYQIKYNVDADTVKFKVGEPPNELKQGQYDFKIVVYEEGFYFPVAILDPDAAEPDPMVDSLVSRKFETNVDDGYYYTIKSVEWLSGVDANSNGYYAKRSLTMDVNVDKNEQRKIWVKVFYQHKDSARSKEYTTFFNTDTTSHSINGLNDANDKFTVEIGGITDSTKLLYKSEYNFLVDILEFGAEDIMTSAGSKTHAVLALQKFETATQDTL